MTSIGDYHQIIKARLIADPLVLQLEIRRERRTVDDGHLRVHLVLRNGDQLEFSEYVRHADDQIQVVTYSFHWTDANGNLIRRWDNAPHFPHLPEAPDHIHDGSEENVIPGAPMRIAQVLDLIGSHIDR